VRIVSDDTEGEAGAASQVRSDYVLRVGYSGGTFSPPGTPESIGYQYCQRNFQVAIEIKDLRSEDKAVQLLEDVENLLMGFCPCIPGVIGGIALESDRFIQNREGVYFYSVNFSIPVIVNV
jgi:hypothetical protein